MSATAPLVYPVLQLRPNSMLVYDQVEYATSRPPRSKVVKLDIHGSPEKSNLENLKNAKTYAGQLNINSKKRLQKAINLLVAVSKPKTALNFRTNSNYVFKVNFVTLTLPCAQGNVSDKEIKKRCLDPWLKSMRYRYKLCSYVWRCERQFNGNLHFHVTTDTYLPYDEIRNIWNIQLEKLGYIDKFEEKHGNRHPNSTDVHSVNKIRNIAAYMVKYMSKDANQHLDDINDIRESKGKPKLVPENHPFQSIDGQPKWDEAINGKVWDCSSNLKQKIKCDMILGSEEMETLNLVRDNFPQQVIKSDFCVFVWFTNDQFEQVIQGTLKKRWLEYLELIRNPMVEKKQETRLETKDPDNEKLERKQHRLRQLNIDYRSFFRVNRAVC